MPGFLRWLGSLRRERAARRHALALIGELFEQPERLAGTSLRRRHRSRWVYLRHETDSAGDITCVDFGILRHPRPYSFSPQSHKVIEHYSLDVHTGALTRHAGLNLTRAEGKDAD